MYHYIHSLWISRFGLYAYFADNEAVVSTGFAEQESPPLLKEDFLGDRPVNFSSLDGNVNPVLYKNVVSETSTIPPVCEN
jgi:hypothetical protein